MFMSESFLRAVRHVKKLLPSLRETLCADIDAQYRENDLFHTAFEQCFEFMKDHFAQEYSRPTPEGVLDYLSGYEAEVSREQLRNLLLQHLLLNAFLRCAFPNVFGLNQMALQLEHVSNTIENREWVSLNVDTLFHASEVEVRAASTQRQKQQVISHVCEQFFNGFDPVLSQEMSIVYTPQEIIEFMCASTITLFDESYGRSFSRSGCIVIDPCAGIAQFLVEIMLRLDKQQLPYKYTHELFGIEILIAPYYIATLNIEQTFFDLTGKYQAFTGMRFADALLS